MHNTNKPTPACDEIDPNILSVEAARARLLQGVTPLAGYQQLAVRSSLDRILAEEVHATINVPAHTNSAMDGYAMRGEDIPAEGTAQLTVVGRSMAGAPFDGAVAAGEAVRIMTGAKLPAGADTVIMQEHANREEQTISIGSGHKPGQNVRHPGEDLAVGERVFAPGRRIAAADLGMLASMGIAEVRVYRRVRVAFCSTGDELASVGQPLGEGQVYDSNRYTLFGMLSRLGADVLDMGVIPDEREAIEAAFHTAAAEADVLITSGGVSVGEADFVKETLQRIGEVDFWKVAMKPGRPLAAGHIGDCRFFGLPGNPVSAMVTFYQFVQPALKKMAGETLLEPLRLQLRTVSDLRKAPGRAEFQRGWMERTESGELVVRSTGQQGSGMLSSMARANCFIVLPTECGKVAAGETVEVEPFAGIV